MRKTSVPARRAGILVVAGGFVLLSTAVPSVVVPSVAVASVVVPSIAGPSTPEPAHSQPPVGVVPWRSQEAGTVRVVLETELGEIEIEVDAAHAPVTTANFLAYLDAGHYDGGRFTRTVTLENQTRDDVLIEVIQAGVNPELDSESRPAIALERTRDTGMLHVDGAISMARGGPDTATSSFFICIGDQPSLDFGGARNADGQGFAAFGRVVRGMDVVRRIHRAPADERERLTPPITIIRATRAR